MSKRSWEGGPGNRRFQEPQKFFPRNARGDRKAQPRTAFRNGGRANAPNGETFALEMFGRIERGVVMAKDDRNNLAGSGSGIEAFELQGRAKHCGALKQRCALRVHAFREMQGRLDLSGKIQWQCSRKNKRARLI